MKLSKEQIQKHEKALQILSKDTLNLDEKIFVYENYIPAYHCQIRKGGIYFTPTELARDFAFFVNGNKIIDLCAGIGTLSFWLYNYRMSNKPEITCVEINPEFVKIGKKLLPEANWILGDVTDEKLIKSLGHFDSVIANPPFGNIKSCNTHWLKYNQSNFEFKIVEIGKFLAPVGNFILSQGSLPFRYSGECYYKEIPNTKYKNFYEKTRIALELANSIDTSSYVDQWLGTSIMTEIVVCEYLSFTSEYPQQQLTISFS